jgi:hypothetical protein
MDGKVQIIRQQLLPVLMPSSQLPTLLIHVARAAMHLVSCCVLLMLVSWDIFPADMLHNQYY